MKTLDGLDAIIVGGEDMIGEKRYSFYRRDGERLGGGWFENDADAETHCKQRFPKEYAEGIEMRCWGEE